MSGGRRGALVPGPAPAALAALGILRRSDTTRVSGGAPGLRDDRTTRQVVTTLVGGKNVFIPSTIVVTEGHGQTLSFYNTVDTPHGMTIPGLGVEAILPPGEEFVVELPPVEAGHVYQVQCHLHPPHRTATLVVLPGR